MPNVRLGRPAGMSEDESDSDDGLAMASAPPPRVRAGKQLTNGAPAKVSGLWIGWSAGGGGASGGEDGVKSFSVNWRLVIGRLAVMVQFESVPLPRVWRAYSTSGRQNPESKPAFREGHVLLIAHGTSG